MRFFVIMTGLLLITAAGETRAQGKNRSVIVMLSGTVYENDSPMRSKQVYYKMAGDIFSPKRFIKTDTAGIYRFRWDKSVYAKKPVSPVVFAIAAGEDVCSQEIKLDALVAQSTAVAGKFSFYSDIEAYFDCWDVKETHAEGAAKQFVGTYSSRNADTSFSLDLQDMLLSLRGSFSPNDKKGMREWFGYWDYDENKKSLIFSIVYKRNSDMGLIEIYRERAVCPVTFTAEGKKSFVWKGRKYEG
jgi:hypothetical protein